MMKNILAIIIMVFFIGKNNYSQIIFIRNNHILVKFSYYECSKDTILIEIKNNTEKKVLICMIDGVKKFGNYIGIGLFSGALPFLPEHVSKYYGKLKFRVIRPNGSMFIKEKIKTDILEDFSFKIDYMVLDDKNNNGNNEENENENNNNESDNEYEMIEREVYNKRFYILEFRVMKD